MAYIAAVAAHPAYTARFQADLVQPGLAHPADGRRRDVRRGRRAGARGDLAAHVRRAIRRPRARPPRQPAATAEGRGPPHSRKDGAIPDDPAAMPDEIGYDETTRRLLVGTGYIDNVPPAVWGYEVSGKHVLTQWFSYRKTNRERPIIGDRRPPSKLGNIQPDHWLAGVHDGTAQRPARSRAVRRTGTRPSSPARKGLLRPDDHCR